MAGFSLWLAKYFHSPVFWWPYKLIVIGFAGFVLVILWLILPVRYRYLAMILYWLNPYFIFSSGWEGFLDDPYLLFGLLAVLCAQRFKQYQLSWILVGIFTICAGLFKPQGLLYFIGGTGLFLGIRYIQRKDSKLIWFGIGISSVVIPLTLYFWPHWYWLYRYIVDFSSVNESCPSCTGIWRAVEIGLAILQGSAHPSRDMGPFIDPTIYRILDAIVLVCILLLLVWFILHIKPVSINDKHKTVLADANTLLLIMTFTSLVIPQLATRAHVNHTHAAMVLLIPFALGNRRIILAILGMSLINLYFLLTEYPPRLVPTFVKAPDPISLITIPDSQFFRVIGDNWGSLISFIVSIRSFNYYYVWGILGLFQFMLVVVVIKQLFALSTSKPLEEKHSSLSGG